MTLKQPSKQRQERPDLGIMPTLHIFRDTKTLYVLDEPINLADPDEQAYIGNLRNSDIYDIRQDYQQIVKSELRTMHQRARAHQQEARPHALNTIRRLGTQLAANELDKQHCYLQLESIIDTHATGSWIATHARHAHEQLTDKPINQGLADTLIRGAEDLTTNAAHAYTALIRRMRAYDHDTPDNLEKLTRGIR